MMSIQYKYFYTTVSQLRSVPERLRLKVQVGVRLLGGGGGIVMVHPVLQLERN